MGEKGRGLLTDTSTERGASPLVGIVLLIGLVLVSAILVVAIGMVAMDAIQSQASGEHGTQVMREFDTDLETAILDNSTSGSVYLDKNGKYDIVNEASIKVTAANEYASRSTVISMGSLRYEDDSGNVFAHQAGGVWRGEGDESRVVSKPAIRYYEYGDRGRVALSIPNLSGNVDGGANRVVSQPASDNRAGKLTRDLGFVNYVNITVSDTDYHNAWAKFFEDEFDASSRDDLTDCAVGASVSDPIVCHEGKTVTVVAPIEGKNPFASHVGIDPTIYGGLYTDDDDLTVDDSVRIERYNGSVGWVDDGNVTEDLLVANGDIDLQSNANITGVPVANGQLSGTSGAVTSSIAFATKPDGMQIDVINGTNVYNVTGTTPPDVFGAKMIRSFDAVEPIDTEIDRAIGLIDEYGNTTTGAAGTLESAPDRDGFYHATGTVNGIDTIDTSKGAVHVAVDGDLDLDDVDVVGNGRAYFYVSGDVDADDVTVSNEQARRLWIYGTGDAEVTVRDEFQGAIYAPGSDSLRITKDTEVFGTVVGGNEADIRENVSIHFDKTLRTDIPIPEENRAVSITIAKRRPPLDVTFVLDRSGSMASNDPDEKRVDATKEFIGLLNAGRSDQAGVYEFNANGHEIHSLSGNLSSVTDSITTRDEGSTDMSAGMEPALDEYAINGNDAAERHMVLLSDGQNTADSYYNRSCGCLRFKSDTRTMNQAERAADMNVTIHTIGLSDSADEDMLKDVADETGGNYYSVENDDELEEVFRGIADEVTASSETSFAVSSFEEPTTAPKDYSVTIREQSVTLGKS
ncbi:vWA domain-containing protein [Natrinema halophilum]|uniref:VWA domain-containing protein n=1 Tax=Natrinema halophilum TaxID=1699371 RepID=A0A7D5KIS1_9EURY|nr:vWA domain-containing protein [Natrinema halophilum]QLG48839.1 VWA domain-containing protein [Natrinema halophilum]